MMKSFPRNKVFNPLLVVILLTLIGLYLRLSNLGALSFHHDEYYMVSAAKGYLETGDFRLWDFARDAPLDHYGGKWLYTWLVAKSFSLFGFSEFAARIPGVIIGTLSILLIYFVFSQLTCKSIALITSLLFTFDETAIYLSRFTRQYSLFLATYLLAVFYFWKGFETYTASFSPSKHVFSKLDSWRKKHNTSPQFLLVGLAFFLLSCHLHKAALNFVPTLFIYFFLVPIIPSFKKSNAIKKYLFLTISFAVLFVLVLALNILDLKSFNLLHILKEHLTLNIYATYVKRPNFIYYSYLFEKYRFPLCANLFLIVGIIYLLKEYRQKGLYILSMLFVPLALSIYFWKRYEDFRYIYFLKPFAMLVLSTGVVSSTQGILKFANSLIKKLKWKTTFRLSNTGTLPNILSFIICLITLTFISFPGIDLPPWTVKAQADWTGPEGFHRIHRRALVPDYGSVYKYISQQADEKDLLIVQGGTGIQAGIYLENKHPWNINYLPWRSSNLYNREPSSIPEARYNDQAGLEVAKHLLPYSFWSAISQYTSGWIIFSSPHLLNQEILHFVTNNLKVLWPFASPAVFRWKTETPVETELSSIHSSIKESPKFFVLPNGRGLLRYSIKDRFLMPGNTFPISLYLEIFPNKQIKEGERRFENNAFCAFKFKLIGSMDTFVLSTSLVNIPYTLNKILTLDNFLDIPKNATPGEYKLHLSIEEVKEGGANNQNDLRLCNVFVANQTREHALPIRLFPLRIINLKKGFLMTNYPRVNQEAIDTNKLRMETVWYSSEPMEDPMMFIGFRKEGKLNTDSYHFIQPKPIKQNLIFTENNKKLVVPLNTDTHNMEWEKGELIKKVYEVNLPKDLCGEYEARMVMAAKNREQGTGNREQEVKLERGDLYALTPYEIYGGSLKLTRENRVESMNVKIGADDLQEGKWTLDFEANYSDTSNEEKHYKLELVINRNKITEIPILCGRKTEDISSTTPLTMLKEFWENQIDRLNKEEKYQVKTINNETETKEELVTWDKQTDRILINIPRIMLKGGKNKINFLLNTKQENGGIVIGDIKLINKKRICFDDDNSIRLGKVILENWKEDDDETWCNPYHTLSMVNEKPEWVTPGKEQINLGDAVLLDYTYPEMREDKLCVNFYWQIKHDERSNPINLQLINSEDYIVFEHSLLTSLADRLDGEVLEENLKLQIPCDLKAGWYKVVLSESGNGKQVLLGKVRLKGNKIIEDYTCLTTRDYGKDIFQEADEKNKSGSIILADWDVRGSRVSLKWRLEGGRVNSDLQFVIQLEGGGTKYTQRYFPQKPVFEWQEGEYYWEDYRLILPERNNSNVYKVGIALWDPMRESYVNLNDKKNFIHIGETIGIKEKTPDGILLKKSKEPFFFDETTLEAKIIDQLEDLRTKELKDLNLNRKDLELLKYDVLVADRVIEAEERALLDEYVEGGGIVIESQDKPSGNHVWELINSKERQDEHRQW